MMNFEFKMMKFALKMMNVDDEFRKGLIDRTLFRYEEEENQPAYGSPDNFADYNELVLQYG